MMKPVKLAVTTIGDRTLRFCLIDGENKVYTCNDMHMVCHHLLSDQFFNLKHAHVMVSSQNGLSALFSLFETGCQPLFLGSDILQGLPEWDKNMCRIHARLAKQGLATKLVFRECRIDGLRKGDEAYFYSVRGLFRAVFEYHSLPVQRHCLQLFTDVWMKASAESQQQLGAKHEVFWKDLVVDNDWPPPYAADRVDTQRKHRAPAPPTHRTKKIMAGAGKTLSGQQHWSASAGPNSAAVEGRAKEGARETTACGRDSEPQTGHPFILTGAGQETVVVETVCKMCHMRRRMTARQQAEVDSMCQAAKKARHQECVEGGGDAPQLKVPEGSMVTGRVTAAESMAHVAGEKGENISVESTSVFSPRLSCVPYSIPVVNSSPSHDLSAGFHLKVNQMGHLSTGSEHQIEEPGLTETCASSTRLDVSVAGLSPLCGTEESRAPLYTPCRPQQTVEDVAARSSVTGQESFPLEARTPVSEFHQVGKSVCRVQTQTCDAVHSADSSFPAAESTFAGAETFAAENHRLHPAMGPGCVGQQWQNGQESSAQALTATASCNEPQGTNVCHGSFQTGGVDVGGCVQLWMEEVRKLKQQLASPDARTSQHGGVAQAVPTTHLQHSQLELMQVVLTFLLHCTQAITTTTTTTTTTPRDVSLISEILALMTNAAENSEESARSTQEWPVSPPLKLSLMSALGTWLGKEFHQFRPAIAQRVTAFKLRHITNISDLPPPAEVIGQLFPPCMLTFTSAWLGVADARHAAEVRQQQDHCYGNGSRETSATQHHSHAQHHALQQLLLELLNDSLVSGIAHVVYCKL